MELGILQKPLIREAKKMLDNNRESLEKIFSETLGKHKLLPGESRIVTMVFTALNTVNYSVVALDGDNKIVRVIETRPLYELCTELIDLALK